MSEYSRVVDGDILPDFTVLSTYAGFDALCPKCRGKFPVFAEDGRHYGECQCGYETEKSEFYGWGNEQ
jgi:hypothetical protein